MNFIDTFIEYLLLEKKYSIHTITAYKNDLYSLKNFCVETYQQEDLENINLI